MTKTYSEEDMYKAFISGFLHSGEGWNGEYPFSHRGHLYYGTEPDLRNDFEKWQSEEGM